MAEAKDLMQRYCDGDAGAFRELCALVAPRLLAIAALLSVALVPRATDLR